MERIRLVIIGYELGICYMKTYVHLYVARFFLE